MSDRDRLASQARYAIYAVMTVPSTPAPTTRTKRFRLAVTKQA